MTNRDPVIQTTDSLWANEDTFFSVDYDSDDDPSTNWSIVSGPSWLTIDNTTGVLSGTPNNAHIGAAIVNISVEDGIKFIVSSGIIEPKTFNYNNNRLEENNKDD